MAAGRRRSGAYKHLRDRFSRLFEDERERLSKLNVKAENTKEDKEE